MGFVIQMVAGKAAGSPRTGVVRGLSGNTASGHLGANTATTDPSDTA